MNIDFNNASVVDIYWNRKPRAEWLSLFSKIAAETGKTLMADLGCGNGVYGRSLARQLGFAKLFLVDSSLEVVSRLRQSSTTDEIIQLADASKWSCSLGSVDFILLKSVLHHQKDREGTLDHLAQQLNHGGVIAIQSRTREQFLDVVELEFFLNTLTTRRDQVASSYPNSSEVTNRLKRLGLRVRIFNYVDVFDYTTSDHLAKLKQRAASSVLRELSNQELETVLDLATRRYEGQPHLEFRMPMTVWVGTRIR